MNFAIFTVLSIGIIISWIGFYKLKPKVRIYAGEITEKWANDELKTIVKSARKENKFYSIFIRVFVVLLLICVVHTMYKLVTNDFHMYTIASLLGEIILFFHIRELFNRKSKFELYIIDLLNTISITE